MSVVSIFVQFLFVSLPLLSTAQHWPLTYIVDQ